MRIEGFHDSRGSLAQLADDLLLVDVFKDVRRVDEQIDGPSKSHGKENVQLKTIDHQRHVLPVLLHLERNRWGPWG